MARASYWTAFGAVMLPLGAILLMSSPSNARVFLGIIFVVIGGASFLGGWTLTIQAEKREKDIHKLRVRREKTMLITSLYLAEKQGVDMKGLERMLEEKLDDDDG